MIKKSSRSRERWTWRCAKAAPAMVRRTASFAMEMVGIAAAYAMGLGCAQAGFFKLFDAEFFTFFRILSGRNGIFVTVFGWHI